MKKTFPVFVFLCMFQFFVDSSQAQSSNFFYSFISGDYTFNKRNDDGTNPVTVYTPPETSQINTSAVDGSISKVYFYESATNNIYKSDYNGSNKTTALTTSGPITSLAAGNGYLFYAYSSSPYSVRRCSSTGSGDIQLYMNAAYGTISCVAFDATNNYLYYYEGAYDAGGHNRIFRTDASGLNMTVIYNNCPSVLCLTAGGGYVYYAINSGTYALYRRTSSGGSETTIYTPSTGSVSACTYDGSLDKLFFYDTSVGGSKVIYKANPDGSNLTTVYSGFTYTLNSLSSPTAIPYTVPTVTSQAVSNISVTTATGNGNVTNLGVPSPTQYGVVWSTSTNPTVALGTKTTQGAKSSTGTFISSITGLSANATYYVRAYATNTAGTSYGEEVSFTTLTSGTFTAATSNDWSTATNWAGGSVPTSATDVTIPSGKNPVISATTQASCKNLTVTGSLTIQSSNSGTGSLIIIETSTGTVTAERFLTGNKWHIVTPIAAFGSISTFIQASGNAIPLKDVTGTNRYGMMDYNETTNTWNTYYAATTSDILPAGKGYSLRRSSDGIVTFSGELTSGTKLVFLSMEGAGWNCIGNPYSSAINMNDAANGTYNFLKTNSSALDGSYACMYLWDDATLSYKILGNVSFGTRDLAQNILQSGQGFFVKTAYDGAIAQFTQAMQVHSTTTNLKSTEVAWPSITLDVSNNKTSASAVVAFNNSMTKGLDPTYDAGLLRGTSGLEIYSRLVDDNGVDFAIQCLPEIYHSLIIPIGLESKTDGEITFSAETVDLPATCKVILEDKTTKTFTSLADGATYKTTVSAGSTAVGRFYIHTGDNSTTETAGHAAIGNLIAYTANRAISIEGEVGDHAIATLYNAQGLRVRVQPLKKGSMNTFSCPELMNGVYMLTIEQNGEKVIRKLFKK